MKDEYGRDLSDYDVQQDYIDKVVIGLEAQLGLDRTGVIKALTDWVYVNNNDIDWLEFAAKDDVAGLSDYHTGLQEFIGAATQAWRKASGEKGHFDLGDVLEQIEDLIDVYREQKKHERRD